MAQRTDRFEFDRMQAAMRAQVLHHRLRVALHVRIAVAQRIRVGVAIRVLHAAVGMQFAKARVVREHGPRARAEPVLRRVLAEPLERRRLAVSHFARHQRRKPTVVRARPVVHRAVLEEPHLVVLLPRREPAARVVADRERYVAEAEVGEPLQAAVRGQCAQVPRMGVDAEFHPRDGSGEGKVRQRARTELRQEAAKPFGSRFSAISLSTAATNSSCVGVPSFSACWFCHETVPASTSFCPSTAK